MGKKKKLEALGGRPVTLGDLDRYDAFIAEFEKETDRGAALLASAYLENAVEALLRKTFIEHGCADKLFEASGPLATFASRIDLAFALGLIDDQTRTDLNLIRDIRNDFAHHPDTLTFDHQNVKDRCASFFLVKMVKGSARQHFYNAVLFSFMKLSTRPTKRPVPPPPTWGTPPDS